MNLVIVTLLVYEFDFFSTKDFRNLTVALKKKKDRFEYAPVYLSDCKSQVDFYSLIKFNSRLRSTSQFT